MESSPPLSAPAAPSFVAASAPLDQRAQVANYWHTLALILLLVTLSFASANSQHKAAGAMGRPLFYLSVMAFEWLLVGFVYIGVRRRGVRVRELIGGRWHAFDDVLLDVAIAAGFWFGAAIILVAASYALGLAGRAEEMRKALDFLVPHRPLEFVMWIALSCTAGFCEEIIYRGYLQRQLASLTTNIAVGVIASAVVFGASHAYEGGARMILIGLYGAMFGTLAALRQSLRPGMIAHAWHDALSGVLLGLLRRA